MKKLLCLMMTAVLALSVVACGSSSSSSSSSSDSSEATESTDDAEESTADSGETFKIGVIGPMTGDYAQYGLGVYNAAVIAAEEINAAGGINGYQIEILDAGDDQGDPEKAVNAYNDLLDKGMQILDGTVTSAACIAVAAEAAEETFLFTPSGSAVDCITAGSNQFRMCFTDPMQGTKSAQYISENGLATKVAVIYDSAADYNVGIHDSFIEAAAEYGLEVVADEAYTTDSNTDFSVQLNKVKESGAELLFLPNYYSDDALILQQAADIGLDILFFGVDGMDGILAVENFDTSLAEGAMLLTPFSATAEDELTQSFVAVYEEAYGETPNQFAADSYDVIYAIKLAAEDAGITPDMSNAEISEALTASMLNITLEGLTGTSTWTEDGECDKSPKAVVIENGAYTMM
ncbi:MAG: ABC transporter substrate-binding protein [Lachnospiraceae bacterium]|nr:ABC transporter substrate-binding protein [Lachnospiraceae bacterium]